MTDIQPQFATMWCTVHFTPMQYTTKHASATLQPPLPSHIHMLLQVHYFTSTSRAQAIMAAANRASTSAKKFCKKIGSRSHACIYFVIEVHRQANLPQVDKLHPPQNFVKFASHPSGQLAALRRDSTKHKHGVQSQQRWPNCLGVH